MNFLNSLYHILSKETGHDTVRYDIQLHPGHVVYQAHFPGLPITPGACIVQIAKELLEDHLRQPLTIKSVKNAKFLKAISPVDTPRIAFCCGKIAADETASAYKVQFQVQHGDTVLAKLSLTASVTDNNRGICVVIPTYNNGGTIADVVRDTLKECRDVIVVNDGSTDGTSDILHTIEGITIVEYPHNQGKGHALRCGFERALQMGFAYAITLDGDGQHFPRDIQHFLQANQQHPGALIIGSRQMDGSERSNGSRFANSFSNFWFFVQTWHHLPDTQTGYRLYPLRKTARLIPRILNRYEAELALLVLAAWHGVELVSIPVEVYYPPRQQRVSHFRPGKDFLRISLLNTILTILAPLYGWPLTLCRFFANYEL